MTVEQIRNLIKAYKHCNSVELMLSGIIAKIADSSNHECSVLGFSKDYIFEALTEGLNDKECAQAAKYLENDDLEGIWCLHNDKEGIANEFTR